MLVLPEFHVELDDGVDVTDKIKTLALDIVQVYKKLNSSSNDPNELPLLMAAASMAHQSCYFSKVCDLNFPFNSQILKIYFPFCLISGAEGQRPSEENRIEHANSAKLF